MNDLISRNALLAEYDRVHIGEPGKARKLIEDAPDAVRWISVKDRLPKPNKLVLCWWQSGDGEKEHYGFATFQSHGVWYVSNEGMPEVTHWMPLPEPPKGAKEE